ncbi:hypothetical protein [Marinobacter alexandrii]|jgi:streptogramin lyase|uniref:hypothetical protein n=1 Tax=Marinobacter alexandrii TaxID=2570351 RepID=UPI001109E5F3|nr:hypothetical protein [Marinobacter alexandrii]MCK2151296.1 polyribonucleotide nucleotidyltransferase [Marinobacter alexandrii]
MNAKLKKSVVISVVAGFSMQLVACGTILYPERKGQSAGHLDPAVVVLDGIGLLFFLVPGVIAFAVDFSNGTIYLPGGVASVDSKEVNAIQISGEVTNEKIEQAIFEQTGEKVSLDDEGVQSREGTTTLSALNREVRFL